MAHLHNHPSPGRWSFLQRCLCDDLFCPQTLRSSVAARCQSCLQQKTTLAGPSFSSPWGWPWAGGNMSCLWGVGKVACFNTLVLTLSFCMCILHLQPIRQLAGVIALLTGKIHLPGVWKHIWYFKTCERSCVFQFIVFEYVALKLFTWSRTIVTLLTHERLLSWMSLHTCVLKLLDRVPAWLWGVSKSKWVGEPD